MATIFTYEQRGARISPVYNVLCGDLQIGTLTKSRENDSETNFMFLHQQSRAKIEFCLLDNEIAENPLLAFEKQLARIAGAIYPPLMVHLSNP